MSLYIALLALAVAVVAVIRGNRTAARLNQLEQRKTDPVFYFGELPPPQSAARPGDFWEDIDRVLHVFDGRSWYSLNAASNTAEIRNVGERAVEMHERRHHLRSK